MTHLSPPTSCPYCGSSVSLVENKAIYGANFGNWPWAYRCDRDGCDSYVGTHPHTKIPLGTMANKETREARKAAHAAFDPLWKGTHWTRSKAYHWLSQKLQIKVRDCHIAMFDVETCKRVVALSDKKRNVRFAEREVSR